MAGGHEFLWRTRCHFEGRANNEEQQLFVENVQQALCFTKDFSGMLKQVDKIQMISSKLFVQLDTFLKESS